MQQYSFIGIRVSAARQDELVEHLCELGLLPATDVPTPPIAALRGEQVFTTAFDARSDLASLAESASRFGQRFACTSVFTPPAQNSTSTRSGAAILTIPAPNAA